MFACPLFVPAIWCGFGFAVVCCGDLFVILLLYNAMAGRWSAMDPLSVLSDASDSDNEEEEEEEEEEEGNDDAKQPGSPIHEVACRFFSILVCMTVVIVFWRYLLRYVITPRGLVSHL
jgi:hypothetical protein